MAYDTASAKQNVRDASQARNVLAHLKLFKSNAPTIFMAHNVQVFQKISSVLPREISTPFPWAHVTSVSEWLKAYYGDQMDVVGS